MLSEFQQKILWDAWLSSEIRAAYFAVLGFRFQTRQKMLLLSSLLLASGATVTLVTAVVPAGYAWVKPTLTLLAAAMSLWSLVAKNDRSAIDCADLHHRWNMLAMDYEELWGKTWSDDAAEKLAILRKREAEISKSSMTMPADAALIGKMEDNVVMHHNAEIAA